MVILSRKTKLRDDVTTPLMPTATLVPPRSQTLAPSLVEGHPLRSSRRVPNAHSNSKNDTFNHSIKIPQKLKVSFWPIVRVCQIPSVTSFSPKECDSLWWSKNEFKSIRQQLDSTVRRFKREDRDKENSMGNVPHSQTKNPILQYDYDDCVHGLEAQITTLFKRREIRERALLAVLAEQDLQDEEGYRCPKILARIYKKHTILSVHQALLRGISTAQDICEMR